MKCEVKKKLESQFDDLLQNFINIYIFTKKKGGCTPNVVGASSPQLCNENNLKQTEAL